MFVAYFTFLALRIFEVTQAAGRTLGPGMLALLREHKSLRLVCPAFRSLHTIIKWTINQRPRRSSHPEVVIFAF
jgi:hypothetical protein